MTTSSSSWNIPHISFKNSTTGQPKYVMIASSLEDAIMDGHFLPGATIPSQKELADLFGVTVMTVRQAVQQLTERGLLASEQGKGTFVLGQPYRLPMGPLASFAAQIKASGRTIRTKVLRFEQITISPFEQQRMQLATNSAFELVRLRFVNDEPLVLQTSLLPTEIATQLNITQLATESLYDIIQSRIGITIARATETVQAVVLDSQSAELLNRQPGEPALLSVRLTLSDRGQAIMDDKAVTAGNAVVYSADRSADELRLSLSLSRDLPDFSPVESAPTNPTSTPPAP